MVAVLGLGPVGMGIIQVCLRSGHPTLVYEVTPNLLAAAPDLIAAALQQEVDAGRLTGAQRDTALGRLVVAGELNKVAGADLIIEAVADDLQVKSALLIKLHWICRQDAIFATTTSVFSVSELAALSGRPSNFLGLHFCAPGRLTSLVEVVPGLATDPAAFERAWQICRELGQEPVRTEDLPGNVVNRHLVPFLNDAVRLLEAGVAEPEDIDRAVRAGLGHARGPLELLDAIGLDHHLRLADALYAATQDPRMACPPLLRRMVAAGRLGRSTGRGFHTYDVLRVEAS